MSGVRVEQDWCRPKPAEQLARRIERFWERHGYRPVVYVIAEPEMAGHPVHVIRSDMRNGLPRGEERVT